MAIYSWIHPGFKEFAEEFCKYLKMFWHIAKQQFIECFSEDTHELWQRCSIELSNTEKFRQIGKKKSLKSLWMQLLTFLPEQSLHLDQKHEGIFRGCKQSS